MPGFNLGNFGNGIGCTNAIGDGASSIVPNTLETARRHRFVARITFPPGYGFNIGGFFAAEPLLIACESIERPTSRIITERVWNGADYINVPLRVEFDPIAIVLYEITIDSIRDQRPVANVDLGAKAALRWWTKGAFDYQNSRMNFPAARRIPIDIYALNGVGGIIWSYKLLHCWPEVIIPDGFDYKSSEIAKIRLTVQFDKAIQQLAFQP